MSVQLTHKKESVRFVESERKIAEMDEDSINVTGSPSNQYKQVCDESVVAT